MPEPFKNVLEPIIRRMQETLASDVIRVQSDFSSLLDDLLGVLPRRLSFADRGSVLLASGELIADRMDDIAERLIQRMQFQKVIADEIGRAFGSHYFPVGRHIPTVGGRAELEQALAELHRGVVFRLGADLLATVRRTLQLGTLASPGPGFDASGAVNAVVDRRSWIRRLESVVRTELLRAQSTFMDVLMFELDRITPIEKEWLWSRIQRPEHAAIDGQRRLLTELFRVPLRPGEGAAFVLMRYPRDPEVFDVPSAVINCGCLAIPRPVGELPAGVAA